MTDNYEHRRAIMESQRNDASDAWNRGAPFPGERERRHFENGFESGWVRCEIAGSDALTLARAEITALQGEVEGLRAALKPFAICCDEQESMFPRKGWADNIAAFSGLCAPTMGQLRAARAALSHSVIGGAV